MWRWNTVGSLIAIIVVACCRAEPSPSQPRSVDQGTYAQAALPARTASRQQTLPLLYPNELDERPTIPSPCTTQDGTEILTAILKNGKYAAIPVTVENG